MYVISFPRAGELLLNSILTETGKKKKTGKCVRKGILWRKWRYNKADLATEWERDLTTRKGLNSTICRSHDWSSQLFDLRAPSSTNLPVLLLNQPIAIVKKRILRGLLIYIYIYKVHS